MFDDGEDQNNLKPIALGDSIAELPSAIKQDNSLAKDFLIAEYTQLFSEIRSINEKVSVAAKLYLGLLTSLIIYVLLGIQAYTSSMKSLNQPIFMIYSIIGMLVTLSFYLLGHIASRQYAVSKMHRVRYWKAIHAIRAKAADLFNIKTALILPRNDKKPNISTGERVTPYIFGFLNIIFASIIFWFIYIIVAINKNELQFTEKTVLNSVGFFFEFYLIPTLLVLPSNCVYYSKQLYRASLITFQNPFPGFNVSSKHRLLQDWTTKRLQKRRTFLIITIALLNLLILTLDYNAANADTCIIKIFAWIFILLLLFLYGLIYVYPFLEPKTICKLCRNHIMPDIKRKSPEFIEAEFAGKYKIIDFCTALSKHIDGIKISQRNDSLECLNRWLSNSHFYEKLLSIESIKQLNKCAMRCLEEIKAEYYMDSSEDNLKKLNRRLIELLYPNVTPKLPKRCRVKVTCTNISRKKPNCTTWEDSGAGLEI